MLEIHHRTGDLEKRKQRAHAGIRMKAKLVETEAASCRSESSGRTFRLM